jgi:hypothetical protein
MNDIIKKHLSYPICRTYAGCRTHVVHCTLAERWQLAYALKCADPEKAGRFLWEAQKNSKRVKPCGSIT